MLTDTSWLSLFVCLSFFYLSQPLSLSRDGKSHVTYLKRLPDSTVPPWPPSPSPPPPPYPRSPAETDRTEGVRVGVGELGWVKLGGGCPSHVLRAASSSSPPPPLPSPISLLLRSKKSIKVFLRERFSSPPIYFLPLGPKNRKLKLFLADVSFSRSSRSTPFVRSQPPPRLPHVAVTLKLKRAFSHGGGETIMHVYNHVTSVETTSILFCVSLWLLHS